MKDRYKIPLEMGFWIGLYILWVLVFQNRTITIARTLGVEFCYLIFIAINYYVIINYLIPLILNKKKYEVFLLFVLVSTSLAGLFRAVVSYYITIYFYHFTPPEFSRLYLNSVLNIFIWTSILVTGKMVIDRVKNDRYTKALEKEKIKSELELLKAQHNPHFLFNSLNSLYFQIDKANADARGTLMKLSEMLRYQLYECNAERIPIDNELNYLRSYVELQRIRLDKNYTIDFTIGDNVKAFEIAPLLIIPLVENSFKHVSHYTNKSNKINIALSYSKGLFSCAVSNTTEETQQNGSGGIGLKNLERRLELIYPDRFEMNVSEEGDRYNTMLKIRIDEN
jgi:two-component system LytT family sensor kinase